MTNDCDTREERVTETRWSIFDQAQIETDSHRLLPGRQILGTPWTIVRRMGQGGVGEVFEVEHELLGRTAAFKVLHAHNLLRRGLVDRMAEEGRLLGSLRHPHIVDALDMGVLADGRPYLVLEWLDGRDLRAELQRIRVLSVPAVLDIAMQILCGLSALHAGNIVHRDIKLENLFLCEDGHVVILDLGAAARMGDDVGERAPSLGTPRTMAPEQYEGKPVDGRADVYALGIVLYELLTGRGPFDDVSGIEALRFAHCHRPPAPPSAVAAQFIPAEVDALVLRALAKSPQDRFGSADAMAIEIAGLRTTCGSGAVSGTSIPVEVEEISKVSVTMPSRWGASITWSTLLRTMFKQLSSPTGVASLALLALLLATLALGVATGRRLPQRDIVVGYVE